MRRTLMLSLVVGVLASGCQTAPAAAPAGPEPSVLQPAPPPPNASHIPAGTVLVGTLTDDLSKRETKVVGLGTGADEELPTGTQITLQTVERIELETR